MRQHQVDRALDALHVHREDAHRHDAHVSNRRVGDQLLHVLLGERRQRGDDDGDHREDEDEHREVGRGVREHRQGEAQEPVAAHLEEDAGEEHRPRRRRLDVRVRQPGVDRPHRHFHGEGREEGEPEPDLHVRRELVDEEVRDRGGARLPVHRDDRDQHQQRAGQRVEEELERRVDPPRAAPHADDEEHRDQATLEEEVEEDDVERGEDADHQRLEDEEGDHVLAHAVVDRAPRGEDAERHQERRQHHEEHRDPVDTEVVVDEPGDPVAPLDELEARFRLVEPPPEPEREDEVEHGRDQRHAADVLRRQFAAAAHHEDERNADERQEDEDRKERPVGHRRASFARVIGSLCRSSSSP